MPPNIERQLVRRLEATRPVLLEGFHRDPVEVPTQEARQFRRLATSVLGGVCGSEPAMRDPRTGPEGILLANRAPNLVPPSLSQALTVEWQGPDQEFVQQDAQRVHIAAGVHIDWRQLGLLGAHIFGCAEHAADFGEERPLGQGLSDRLGDAEVNDARDGIVVRDRHEHIGWLQIPMDDAFLVRMLDTVAELDEELEAVV